MTVYTLTMTTSNVRYSPHRSTHSTVELILAHLTLAGIAMGVLVAKGGSCDDRPALEVPNDDSTCDGHLDPFSNAAGWVSRNDDLYTLTRAIPRRSPDTRFDVLEQYVATLSRKDTERLLWEREDAAAAFEQALDMDEDNEEVENLLATAYEDIELIQALLDADGNADAPAAASPQHSPVLGEKALDEEEVAHSIRVLRRKLQRVDESLVHTRVDIDRLASLRLAADELATRFAEFVDDGWNTDERDERLQDALVGVSRSIAERHADLAGLHERDEQERAGWRERLTALEREMSLAPEDASENPAPERGEWLGMGVDEGAVNRLRRAGIAPEEYMRWSAVHVHGSDVVEWREAGFTEPQDAGEWAQDDEFKASPIESFWWHQAGFNPPTAARWKNQGIDSQTEARNWCRFGFPPEDARRWRTGFEPADATYWRGAGFDPWTAAGLVHAGFQHPADVPDDRKPEHLQADA